MSDQALNDKTTLLEILSLYGAEDVEYEYSTTIAGEPTYIFSSYIGDDNKIILKVASPSTEVLTRMHTIKGCTTIFDIPFDELEVWDMRENALIAHHSDCLRRNSDLPTMKLTTDEFYNEYGDEQVRFESIGKYGGVVYAQKIFSHELQLYVELRIYTMIDITSHLMVNGLLHQDSEISVKELPVIMGEVIDLHTAQVIKIYNCTTKND